MNTIATKFLARVTVDPGRPCIVQTQDDLQRTISASEFLDAVHAYANTFDQFDSRARILIAQPPGFDAYAAIFGAIFSGRTFCPIDYQAPSERIAHAVRQFNPSIIVHAKELAAAFPGASADLMTGPRYPFNVHPILRTAANIAYVIFTSGSAGLPKGVGIKSTALSAFLDWAWTYFCVCPDDRWAQFSSLGFDMSLFDIFMSIPAGATCYPLIRPTDRNLPGRFIKHNSITIWNSVPSMIPLISEYNQLRVALDSVSQFIFCGEPLYYDQLVPLHRIARDASIVNAYGPTETTIFCAANRLTPDTLDLKTEGPIPIGKPIPGWNFRFEPQPNETLQEALSSELFILGNNIGAGYIDDQQSDEAYSVAILGGVSVPCYRTGDVFSILNDEYYFERRTDRQVKIRGTRIDMSEIERSARLAGAIEARAVVSSEGKLCLAVASNSPSLAEKSLLESLRNCLPPSCIPTDLRFLQQLPRLINGKMDVISIQQLFEHTT